MTFADLPSGDSVFLDANTFVYHLAPHPVFRSACTQFLDRCGRAEILAFTRTASLSIRRGKQMVGLTILEASNR
jgi:predicted nucleic acid-binding protein